MDDIVAKYNISNREVLRKWIQRYNANKELKDYDPKREVYMVNARRKTTLEERKEIVAYCITHNNHAVKQYFAASSGLISKAQLFSFVFTFEPSVLKKEEKRPYLAGCKIRPFDNPRNQTKKEPTRKHSNGYLLGGVVICDIICFEFRMHQAFPLR